MTLINGMLTFSERFTIGSSPVLTCLEDHFFFISNRNFIKKA
jgi:hypothetical protein